MKKILSLLFLLAFFHTGFSQSAKPKKPIKTLPPVSGPGNTAKSYIPVKGGNVFYVVDDKPATLKEYRIHQLEMIQKSHK